MIITIITKIKTPSRRDVHHPFNKRRVSLLESEFDSFYGPPQRFCFHSFLFLSFIVLSFTPISKLWWYYNRLLQMKQQFKIKKEKKKSLLLLLCGGGVPLLISFLLSSRLPFMWKKRIVFIRVPLTASLHSLLQHGVALEDCFIIFIYYLYVNKIKLALN